MRPRQAGAPQSAPNARAAGATVGATAGATRQSAAAQGAGWSVHKLMTGANLEISCNELMGHLSDQTDFTVVGVLGCQGVGKSTLMSLLAGAGFARGGSRDAAARNIIEDAPFAPQDEETVLNAAHQTTGIDLLVTPERLLLLDTQPLLSPSIMLQLQQREAVRGRAPAQPISLP